MDALLFGSVARGCDDDRSDYDVLICVDDVLGMDKIRLKLDVENKIGRRVGLSIYSLNRLKQMWVDGSPFAWHLYLESKPLSGFNFDWMKNLAQPRAYTGAVSDSQMMASLLFSAFARLLAGTASSCYEAGLLYVCCRNVAMYSSKSLLGNFDFSRSAPFVLSSVVNFPIDQSEYDQLVLARHAATRGASPPSLSLGSLMAWSPRLESWATEIVDLLCKRGC